MPVHDWTRVDAGIFHHFHTKWMVTLSDALNNDLLPSEYYALAEQVAGMIGPDVLALERRTSPGPTGAGTACKLLPAVPPKVQWVFRRASAQYLGKQRRLVIRHRSGDDLAAIVEIVSPGNKSSRRELRRFVNKTAAILYQGIQLLLIDLFPPTVRDPRGTHGALWTELGEPDYAMPPDKPLTLAAYATGEGITAYVQPVAVGESLIDMPLFLTDEVYVDVPLERTYAEAWRGVPRHLREELERP